jgi:hypothetical protein
MCSLCPELEGCLVLPCQIVTSPQLQYSLFPPNYNIVSAPRSLFDHDHSICLKGGLLTMACMCLPFFLVPISDPSSCQGWASAEFKFHPIGSLYVEGIFPDDPRGLNLWQTRRISTRPMISRHFGSPAHPTSSSIGQRSSSALSAKMP